MRGVKSYFVNLDLFTVSNDRQEENEENRYQKWANLIDTRVFLVVLFVSLMTLVVFTWASPHTISITIKNPTQAQIASLPSDRICLCSRISVSYRDFVSSDPTFHQVCSSDFISDRWISSLFYGDQSTYFLSIDLRSIGFAQFQAMASFCQLSKKRVNQILSLFGSTSFTSSHLVDNPTILHAQVEAAISIIRSSASKTFRAQIELISMVLMNNQLLNGLSTSIVPNSNYYQRFSSPKLGFTTYNYAHGILKCYCTQTKPLGLDQCRGIVGIYTNIYDIDSDYIVSSDNDDVSTATLIISGLSSSCMPVDASLLSSLECFYNQSCIDAILPYLRVLENMTMNFTPMNSQLSSRYNISTRVLSIVEEFMVEDWLFQESYDAYFRQCSPSSCTYLKTVHPSFLEVLEIIIGLLGGLCAVLLIVIPLVVGLIRQKFWPKPSNNHICPSLHMSLTKRLTQQMVPKVKEIMLKLNLFQTETSYNDTEDQVHRQRIISRIYILVLLLSVIILTLNLALTSEIYVATVEKPSLSQFFDLYSRYGSSLKCACSNISVPYNAFFTIEPHYHQMCFSDVVSEVWLERLGIVSTYRHFIIKEAYHINAGSQFFLLSTLCSHAQDTISNGQQVFLEQMFVTSQVIDEEQFKLQAKGLFNNWLTMTINSFIRTIKLIQVIHHGNHLAAAFSNSILDLSAPWNIYPSMFYLNSSVYYGQCNCMISSSCRSPMQVHEIDSGVPNYQFDVPGFFMGCSRLEALLNSTLECFYDQTCMNQTSIYTFLWDRSFRFIALNSSLNSPNETIGSVANQLFVDKWSLNISYNDYYTICAPSTCTYEYTRRRRLLGIITGVLGIFGGLTTGLKILLIIFLRLMTKVTSGNCLSFRMMKLWFLAIRHDQQRLKTRLTVILLVIIFSTLGLTHILTFITKTNEISKPSVETYQHILSEYSDTLQCPCSNLSIQYKSFMNISILNRHQVCSSQFITDEWIGTFLLSNLQSSYSPLEFQTSAIGFFQLLASLCQFTEQYLVDELSDLVNQTIIHSQVVSPVQLEAQIQSMIKQFQSDISNSFLNMLELVRTMISNNTLISLFQTNWKWMDMINVNTAHWGKILHTNSIIYNDTCNCGLTSQCILDVIAMSGLKVGCYPLEALLKSNLQCLYNQSCINLLQSTNRSYTPLNFSIPSRYKLDSSVESILQELMIEELIRNVSYEKYYSECSPATCSYSYVSHRAALDIISSLLGFYGGSVIITSALSDIVTYIWRHNHRRVQPI